MSKLWRMRAACCAVVLACTVTAACSSGDGESSSAKTPGSATSADAGSGGDDSDDGGSTAPGTDEGSSTDESPEGSADGASDDVAPGGAATTQTRVLKRLPGSADGGCVPVAGERDVRSGGIGAGPFDDAVAAFRSQQRDGQPATVRLYFIPASGGTQLPGLKVTVRNVRTQDEQTVNQKTTSDADMWTFYDTQVPIPTAGEYEIRAKSGADTGCFRVIFR